FIYVQIPAKLTDGTVTPSGREGDGDFCEYPGEVEEDDRGVGAKANRDRRHPMDRPPVRGRARSAAAHHDSVHVPRGRRIQARRRGRTRTTRTSRFASKKATSLRRPSTACKTTATRRAAS